MASQLTNKCSWSSMSRHPNSHRRFPLYLYWPATPSIQRGLEWPQLLKRLFSVCLFVCKFSNFFLFHPPLFIQYSTEECSTVQLFIYKIIAVMIDIDPSWECIAVYGPVQYSTVQYSTVQYITTVISGSRHYRQAPSSRLFVEFHFLIWIKLITKVSLTRQGYVLHTLSYSAIYCQIYRLW